jgi:putative nucleotidyltransferase with HDIG domain
MFFKGKFRDEKGSAFTASWRTRLDPHAGTPDRIQNRRKKIIAGSILAIFAFIITLICFWGQDLVWVQLVPNSKSKYQIIAETPFEFVSKIKTKRFKEERRNLIAPIYRIDLKAFEDFRREIYKLDELLDAFGERKEFADAYLFELKNFVRAFNERNDVDIAWGDIDTLVRRVDVCGRTGLLIEGLLLIQDILSDGILDQSLSDQRNEEYFLNIEVEGAVRRFHSRTEEEAHRFFKLRLSTVETTAEVLQSVFRILKIGIRSNVVFNSVATAQKITRVLRETPDVIEKVFPGKILIETGAIITDEDYECLSAYRLALRDSNLASVHTGTNLIERFLISFGVLLLIYLFLQTSRNMLKILTSKEFFLTIQLLLINLLLCRVVIWIFELGILDGVINFALAAKETGNLAEPLKMMAFADPICLLPYAMPLTLSAVMGTLLLRTYVGILLGIVTSIFCCLMLSQSAECLVAFFITTFITVYFARHSYIRAQVIRSGAIGGVVFVIMSLMLSLGMHIMDGMIIMQAILAFANCLFTAMFALTFLPFFENLFRCCTNICLIELTDYTNPLLMKLQILAPGTYHHSLMVANLAEQAAISIRANPFLCRTLALYHDVGKLVKPEYFTENQSIANPHNKHTPFMSALIIKSHVKEGIAIARAAKLPPRIVEGIAEHHGTTVIRYFYTKALKQQQGEIAKQQSEGQSAADAGGLGQAEVEKSIFKYDGPRPRSKETLILSVADSIEAASRSLHNPTPQSIQTLTNNIIDGKITDTQFDECRITFKEIEDLRHSFYFTLLNMLHSRVSYDEIKLDEPAA